MKKNILQSIKSSLKKIWIIRKSVDLCDYVFYRIWSRGTIHIKQEFMKKILPIFFLYLMISMPISMLLRSVVEIPDLPREQALLLELLYSSPLYFRYLFNKAIKKNNYEVFRTRWENESSIIKKRRGWIITILLIFNILLLPTISIVWDICHSPNVVWHI